MASNPSSEEFRKAGIEEVLRAAALTLREDDEDPIGWEKAGIVWGYALIRILLLNGLKVLTIKWLNRKGKLFE